MLMILEAGGREVIVIFCYCNKLEANLGYQRPCLRIEREGGFGFWLVFFSEAGFPPAPSNVGDASESAVSSIRARAMVSLSSVASAL